MNGKQPVFGQPTPPPMGFVPTPQPMIQPGIQPQMMGASMVDAPMPQQTQVETTTTPTLYQNIRAECICPFMGMLFFVLVIIVQIAIICLIEMGHSIKVGANRDEVYAAIWRDQLCDNQMKIADTISKTHAGKCVDFKAKWHIKNEVEVRKEGGFADDVIDAKCTETQIHTEMYVTYRNEKGMYSWQTYVEVSHDQPYSFKFPCANCGGTKKFTGPADNAVLRQTEGSVSVDQKVNEELKQEAIRQQGISALKFGNSEKTEVCLTHAGGDWYSDLGFKSHEIDNDILRSSYFTSCSNPSPGDYKMSASCHGPPSTNEVRIIGGLDGTGDRLGDFAPEASEDGISSSNKETVLIWDTDLDAYNNQIVEKHRNIERAKSNVAIAVSSTMFVLALLIVLIICATTRSCLC